MDYLAEKDSSVNPSLLASSQCASSTYALTYSLFASYILYEALLSSLSPHPLPKKPSSTSPL